MIWEIEEESDELKSKEAIEAQDEQGAEYEIDTPNSLALDTKACGRAE